LRDKNWDETKFKAFLVKTLKIGVLNMGKNEFESKKRKSVKMCRGEPRKDFKKQLAILTLLH